MKITLETGVFHRVCEGAADIFAVSQTGARFPLLRIERDNIFGDFPATPSAHLLAIPTLGARLEACPRATCGESEREKWRATLKQALQSAPSEPSPAPSEPSPGVWSDGGEHGRVDAALLEAFIARRTAALQARLEARASTEDAARGQGEARLWGVLEGDSRAKARLKRPRNPLLEAARALGEAAGIEFRAPLETVFPARFAGETEAFEAIKTLGHIGRLRSRAVVLDGDWWCDEAGPLLGFALEYEAQSGSQNGSWSGESGLRAVAFLPFGTAKYRVFDPGDEFDGQTVDATNAPRFLARAAVWTRPFPDAPPGFLKVLRFGLRGAGRDVAVVGALSVVGGILGLLPPLVTAQVFDSVLPGAEISRLGPLVALLGVFALVSALLAGARGVAITRVESRLDGGLQGALWDRLMRLDAGFFRDFEAGDLASRALAVGQVRHLLAGAVVSSLLGGLFSVFNWVLLFVFDAKLALVASAVMILGLGVNFAAGVATLRHEREKNRLAGEVAGLTSQLLSGATALQTGGATGRAFGVWATLFAAKKAAGVRAQSVQNGVATFDAAWPLLASIALFSAVVLRQNGIGNGTGNRLSTGEFLAFSVAFGTLLASGLEVGRGALQLLGIVPLLERARPILEGMPETRPSALDPGVLSGGVEISSVSFAYESDGPLILDEVCLSIAPGQFAALVGPSGSGKSTLLRLLLGFEKPGSGSIYLDGRDLSALDIDAVRRQLGVVLQSGRLLPGSVFDNIAGASQVSLEAAWQAASSAGLAADIEAMPMGMHTVVGEGGSFSGGQKQRLLIARALASNPKILLFDEATSALDNLTQAQVSRSLESLDATRIVVAHRLSTIRHADVIFVLEAGKLVESGSYDDLMAKRGVFAALVERQMA